MKKVDETNFKLSKETQDIKNAQDMNKRNILLNKKSIEEMSSKLLELENKINKDSCLDSNNNENIINQISNNSEKNISPKNKRYSLANEKTTFAFKDKSSEINKELEKKVKEIIKKMNEIDKMCKTFSTLDNFYEIKNEINKIKKDLNNYATNVDFKAVYSKSEENEKEIKYIKSQYEELENRTDIKEEFKSLKKKVETFHNRIENLEINEVNIKKKIDNEINDKSNINQNIKNLLEIKVFENFKNQLTKEFTNINVNFIHTRKLLDEIIEAMKDKASYQDLKIFEKAIESKLEEMLMNINKKFAEKSDTIKSFKYVELQIKTINEIIQRHKGDNNDSWLIAKKPLNSNLCASCESYLGELKDNNPYVPWNKYPLRDSNDKLYRLGNGYSKILQMVNIEENEKKNVSSAGLGSNFKEDLGNLIKTAKNEKSDMSDLGGDVNYNFNRTMGSFWKSPQKNNFPLIKKKILAKTKSDLNNYDGLKKEEITNQRNKNKEINNIKSTENFGANTDNNDNDNDEEQIIVSTSPKITKIVKRK